MWRPTGLSLPPWSQHRIRLWSCSHRFSLGLLLRFVCSPCPTQIKGLDVDVDRVGWDDLADDLIPGVAGEGEAWRRGSQQHYLFAAHVPRLLSQGTGVYPERTAVWLLDALLDVTGICCESGRHGGGVYGLSLIHISEPTRLRRISYAVFCLKKKK